MRARMDEEKVNVVGHRPSLEQRIIAIPDDAANVCVKFIAMRIVNDWFAILG